MIVGIKESDRVVLGATDWVPSYIEKKDRTLEENLPFAVLPEAGIVLGCVSRSYNTDLLFADEALKEALGKGCDHAQIVNRLLPQIEGVLKANNQIDGDGKWENCLMIAKGSVLSDINPSFYLREVTDGVVHGYTVEYVKSYIKNSSGRPAEERIVGAFRFHGQMTDADVFPIALIDTKTMKVKVIRK